MILSNLTKCSATQRGVAWHICVCDRRAFCSYRISHGAWWQ